MPYWCAAQTEARRESGAAHFLRLAGYTIYLPRLRLVRPRGGRKVETRPPLFPCYLFVQITNGWWNARWCPHVIRLITNGHVEPARVPDQIVDSLRQREVNGAINLPRRNEFQVGDQVRILAGPFQGLCGLYQGQRAHERVAILLGLLGRVTGGLAVDVDAGLWTS
jgi:transcriptional antiterminator RfaH